MPRRQVSGSKCGERKGAMAGDRDERRGSIGTLGTNWMGTGGERMRRRGRKKIVAPAEGRTQVLHIESRRLWR